jgi:NADPH:quinone reductase-like Zn-dependent oxidoreductase
MDKAPLKPRHPILGADIAGAVESVGKNVREFAVGDQVFGDLSTSGWGGFAEYVAAPGKVLAMKPDNLNYEESAAVPQAAMVALQGLRDTGELQAGQSVLINGASGGIGTFGVQIAKAMGAEVTAVCSMKNLDSVRSIGADDVIDYTKEDFANSGRLFDLILDISASRSMEECERALNPAGRYVLAGGDISRIMQASMSKSPRIRNHSQSLNQKDLAVLREYVETGKVVPVIDRRFPLSETSEAVRYYGKRHTRGKVVINVV